MELNSPLPRLLRLRGAIQRSLDSAGDIDAYSGGLQDSYARLRMQARELAVAMDVSAEEFDSIFPEQVEVAEPNLITLAKAAASLLGQLDGYLGGLVQAQAINQQITLEQIELAREAARRPPGFTS
jgi:hypothetical protein